MKILSLPRRVAAKARRTLRPHIQTVANRSADAAYERAAKAVLDSVDGSELQQKLDRLVEEIWNERFTASVANRYQNIDEYVEHLQKRKKKRKNPKLAIFTAVTGGYETPKLPDTFTKDADYYVFTDNPTLKLPDTYTVVVVPYFNADPVRIARYVKTHPHILLERYDYALWLDSNITPTVDLKHYITDFISSESNIGLVNHPLRTTVFDESVECIKRAKDDGDIVQQQVTFYGKESQKNGLYESGFYIADLRSPKTTELFTKWWSQIDNWSRRDQLSLPGAISSSTSKVHSLLPATKSVRNNPDFILTPHNSVANKLMDKLIGKVLESERAAPITHSSVSPLVSTPQLDVVVCVHNAPEETRACIDSVLAHTKSLHQLTIVDDGSAAETAQLLKSYAKKHPQITLLRNNTAQRYTKAANKGLRSVVSEFAVLLNSDTIVTPNWDQKMLSVINARDDIAIVGPLSNAASVQSVPDFRSSSNQTAINSLPEGYSIDDMNSFVESAAADTSITQVPLVHGFCYMIRASVLKDVGYLDEKSFPKGYGEENDYCIRVTDAGYSLAVATNTYIYHKKSASYVSKERVQLMANGREALLSKYPKRRIDNAVASMQQHPHLVKIRSEAKKLY